MGLPMTIYQIVEKSLKALAETRFEDEGLYERGDIQRLLRQDITALGDDLLIIAEEFGGWVDSSRRIDLLAIDRNANLVVIELKRTEDGGHMELQAIRYAAMVSGMTFVQAVEAYAKITGSADAARDSLLTFLEWEQPNEEDFALETRIVLVASDFSKELTTAVTWLRDFQLDIQCIRMKPYKSGDGSIFLDVQKIIPLPELKEFQTQIGLKKQAERQNISERAGRMRQFWAELLKIANGICTVHEGRAPTTDNWLSGGIGRAGFSLSYSTKRGQSKASLFINFGQQNIDKKNKAFDYLFQQREDIEREVGKELLWNARPNGAIGTINYVIEGGYDLPEEEWPKLHEQMAKAMLSLQKAFTERVKQIIL